MSALAAAGVVALAPLSGVSMAAAAPQPAPSADKPYPASVMTSTDLRVKSPIDAGERTTAHATVSSGAGTPTGTVTFQVSGHKSKVVPLSGGEAYYEMPTDLVAGKTYKVTAHYNGDGAYRASSDSADVTVRGKRGNGQVKNSDGSQNGESGGAGGTGENGGNGGKGRPAPVAGNGGVVDEDATGGLPGTGSDSSTLLYGIGGLVLLGAGGIALALNRRRHNA